MALTVGLRGQAEAQVTAETTAAALGSGDLTVLGTPALVALMERAAVNALTGHLDAADTTVGTAIEVRHLAATPVGSSIRAEAELIAVDARTLVFRIQAHDTREKIGDARHQRVVVTRDRFLAKAIQKR